MLFPHSSLVRKVTTCHVTAHSALTELCRRGSQVACQAVCTWTTPRPSATRPLQSTAPSSRPGDCCTGAGCWLGPPKWYLEHRIGLPTPYWPPLTSFWPPLTSQITTTTFGTCTLTKWTDPFGVEKEGLDGVGSSSVSSVSGMVVVGPIPAANICVN